MSNDRSFAAFILTHGRAKNVVTYKALRKSGYTGRIFLLVDDEDTQLGAYRDRYGDEVVVFNKQKYVEKCDKTGAFGKRGAILFARHANFDVAKSLGLTHFWQLDDDYTTFNWASDNSGCYLNANSSSRIKNLDNVLAACIEFLDNTPTKTVAFAQGGDFIGGGKGRFAILASQWRFSRKAMNTFICRADDPIDFRGFLNDDVNAYTTGGLRGELFITIPRLRISQLATQSQGGGVTDAYKAFGTYVKSFVSVIYAPSCVKVSMMGDVNRRIHHQVQWRNTAPLVLSEKYRAKG